MQVRVLFFAQLREAFGSSEKTISLPEEKQPVRSFVEGVLKTYHLEQFAQLPLRFAVNNTYVTDDHRLEDGDVIAIIPPVCGG